MRKKEDNSGNGKIKVFIADSYPVFRQGLASHFAITPDLVAVGQSGTGEEMMAEIALSQANVLCLDAGLSGLAGFMLLKRLKETCPDLSVLLMASSQEIRWLLKGIQAGASGVVARTASLKEFELAIRRVYAGQPYMPEPFAEQLVVHFQRNECEPLDERLSPREFEVMQWLVKGLKLSEIAETLEVSHQTVTTHRRHILEKTGLRNTAEIIRYGILNGVGEPKVSEQ
ncbi:MAG: response regulator transcription factor [bacterium]|jgi:DNA-binding NarL/FixJ family response regulator